VRTSEDFWLDPSLKSFQKLEPGHAFACHSGKDWVAQTGEYIIFPRPQANVGAEAFILGEELS
jgi:succinylglutamate desuccinylase